MIGSGRSGRIALLDGAKDGVLFERFGNERRPLEMLRNVARARSRHECERDLALHQFGRDSEALSIRHIDVEQGAIEPVTQMYKGIGDRLEAPHDLMPIALDDRLQI